jgi:hypothetical protein
MAGVDDALKFAQDWRAKVLTAAPMIAPARQFTYPRRVAGEEEAMARGALLVEVAPAHGGRFLATCALGFSDAKMPTGIYACPKASELCAVAGGYAYVIDTAEPESVTQIALKPVVEVMPLVEHGLLVFVGFHALVAWGVEGLAWQTGRLSSEGIRLNSVEQGVLRGFGWEMQTDREVEFAVDLRTGECSGGAF